MKRSFIIAVRPPVSIRFPLPVIMALSLFAFSFANPAAAQTCSARTPAATVTVKTSQNTPVSREERTYSELTRLFKKPGTHPAGLYVGAFTVAQQAHYRWTSDGREIGGFKWSSQHPDEGGCDEEAEAAFGSVRAGCSSIARPAPRGAA